ISVCAAILRHRKPEREQYAHRDPVLPIRGEEGDVRALLQHPQLTERAGVRTAAGSSATVRFVAQAEATRLSRQGRPNRYMASKVKRAPLGFLKILSALRSLLSEPGDLRHLVCTAFFATGLQPAGCTKQLYRVKADPSFAWTSRLQAVGLRLRKSCVPHV